MSKDPANLEKALAKKARKAERKAQEKARKVRIETFHTGEMNISQAADWKLLGCWVNDDWDNYQSLNHLIIARQNGAGLIAAGVFLIDLACLGVKDAFARGFSSEYRFQHELLDHMNQMHTMQECTLDFAAKMVNTAVVYARGLGFEPHKDIRKPQRLLGDAQPENCEDIILTGGIDGKPTFINGPYDNVNQIRRTLDRTVGEGNYETVMMSPLGGFGGLGLPEELLALLGDDDEFEDFDDEDFEDDDKTINVKARTQAQ